MFGLVTGKAFFSNSRISRSQGSENVVLRTTEYSRIHVTAAEVRLGISVTPASPGTELSVCTTRADPEWQRDGLQHNGDMRPVAISPHPDRPRHLLASPASPTVPAPCMSATTPPHHHCAEYTAHHRNGPIAIRECPFDVSSLTNSGGPDARAGYTETFRAPLRQTLVVSHAVPPVSFFFLVGAPRGAPIFAGELHEQNPRSRAQPLPPSTRRR
jgi:hypothetical protein